MPAFNFNLRLPRLIFFGLTQKPRSFTNLYKTIKKGFLGMAKDQSSLIARVDELRASGYPIAKACKEAGIPYSTYSYHKYSSPSAKSKRPSPKKRKYTRRSTAPQEQPIVINLSGNKNLLQVKQLLSVVNQLLEEVQ